MTARSRFVVRAFFRPKSLTNFLQLGFARSVTSRDKFTARAN